MTNAATSTPTPVPPVASVPGSKPPLESGWSLPSSVVQRRLILAASGHQKEGKTDLALSAPPPVFVHNFDDGMEGVVEDYKRAGKEIYVRRYRMPKDDRLNAAQKQAAAETLYAEYKAMWADSVARGRGTIVIDTHTEEWEIRRLAAFGKLTQVMPQHYTEVNNALRTDIREAYDSGMNVILLQKLKKRYVGNNWDGKYEPGGYSDMPFLVQMNVECFRDTADGLFKIKIKDSRQNARLANTVITVDRSTIEFEEGENPVTSYSAFDELLYATFGCEICGGLNEAHDAGCPAGAAA